MNDQVTHAMANAMAERETSDVDVAQVLNENRLLAQEVERLQEWLAAIVAKEKQGPAAVLVPPKDLLRVMKRQDVYQEAAAIGYQEAGELAAEALAGEPAPEWAREDAYLDPDDEEENHDGTS